MKKLVLALALVVGAAGASFASNYKLNESAIDAAFEASTQITFDNVAEATSFTAAADGETTKGGFLLRSYFCGFVALHRSYMGTGGATLWWKYLCIPVAGSVVNCVDFWGVVFKGDEQLAKYKDNPSFVVWGNKE
ncbi:MAG: hypothetical protein Salg2KO_01030 [Salibacteraceae bacterium]